ncbi:MAG: alpha-amylase family glycosyl hydrolase, partial [Lactococcus lactis]|nr:alpha-amylase family glycosyl hydrolase [Lactococcus lactis]
NGKYYESEFDKSMPDLNLANPEVKKEIAKITKFWIDKGVSGFRLDAVGFYFSNDDKKTTAFTKCLTDTVKKQNPKAYLVGEVFSTASAIDDIYQSGIDSLFDFPNALQSSSSPINSALVLGEGSLFGQQIEAWDQEIHADNPKAIDAPFLSNHDTDRSATLLSSLSMQKMAAQTYLLMPGNTFIYYGEELGLTGSDIDQNKRLPMQWSADGANSPKANVAVPGATETATTDGGSVAQQETNPNSLLNWYKKILRIKAKYPEIATARLKNISVSKESLSVINYGKDLTIINNFSDTENVTMKLPKGVVGKKITDQLSVSSSQAKLTDGKLTIPAYSTVILKK